MIDRRTFLIAAGLAGPATWLAACGGDDGGESETRRSPAETHHSHDVLTTELTGARLPSATAIIRRFPDGSLVPGSIRLPISLDVGGALLTNGPAQLNAEIADADGAPIVEGIVAPAVQSSADEPQFWIVRGDVATPGSYQLRVDGVGEPATFQVVERVQLDVPKPGDQLPPVETPTVDDDRGVTPICTRTTGICPLHSMTLEEALSLGKPVAFLIATPAYCQFAVCGPVLDLLLDAHRTFGDTVAMVHADVYTDDTATTPAEAVRAYGLAWEPSLFVADRTGMIVDRLDITFGADELREVLERAGA